MSLLVYRLVHAPVKVGRYPRESWVRLPGKELFFFHSDCVFALDNRVSFCSIYKSYRVTTEQLHPNNRDSIFFSSYLHPVLF